MKKEPVIIITENAVVRWSSPERAREFWDYYIDEAIAKWGEIARDVAIRIGSFTIKEIYDCIKAMYQKITLKNVIEILMDFYEKGYIEFVQE